MRTLGSGGLVATTAVLSSALLLFGLEPLTGRLLLPYFGSAIHVWLVCLTFFQATLLLGYLYAHFVAPRLGGWHLLVLFVPLIALPIGVQAEVAPDAPLGTMLWVLTRDIAAPFAVLSTTAVVVQRWWACSALGREREPYPLYAASNAGSLVALLAYPLVVEPLLGLRWQTGLWTAAFLVYAALVVATWVLLRPTGAPVGPADDDGAAPAPAPTWGQRLTWVALAALPSAFLLAVTNQVAIDVGSFPLVWVVPLAVYLSSFLVTFRQGGGVPRLLGELWPELVLPGVLLFVWTRQSSLPLVLLHLGVLAVVALVAHGALYDRRPHPRYLTGFYLWVSVGGWLGGALVTFGAPAVFLAIDEYWVTLLAFVALLGFLEREGLLASFRASPAVVRVGRVVLVTSLIVLIGLRFVLGDTTTALARHRNHYGTYRVEDVMRPESFPGPTRQLMHGGTLHGAEALDPALASSPMAYYHRNSGMALALGSVGHPARVAVIGLGAGVLAAYTEPGDTLDFFEIDADNEALGRRWFTYLDRSKGAVQVFVGDGRLELGVRGAAGEPPYDLVLVDAFSGDGIPTHLLTREALATYLGRVTDDGVVVFHISNRFFDLRPLLLALGRDAGVEALVSPALPVLKWGVGSRVVAMPRTAAARARLADWTPLEASGVTPVSIWTDDYVNILAVVALGG